MPAALQVTPLTGGNQVPYGPVRPAGITLYVVLTNIGNENLVWVSPTVTFTIISGNVNDWGQGSWTPVTLTPNARLLFPVIFAPDGDTTGSTSSVLITFYSNAANGLQAYTFTGTAAASGDTFVQLTQTDSSSGDLMPCVINFGPIAANTPVLSNVITVTNQGGSTALLTLTPLTASGFSIQNQSGTNPMPAAGTLTFQLGLTAPLGQLNQDFTNAVVVGLAGQTYAQSIEATFSTPALVPTNVLNNFNTQMFMGFGTNLLQSLPTNLSVEEIAFITRQYDLGDPWRVKSLERLLMRYERMGATLVTVTYSALSPTGPTSPPVSVVVSKTLDSAVGGSLRNVLFSSQIAGDIITITISLAANAGALSIVLLCPYVEQRGEDIEAT
jgi:hypothetical protein